MLSRQHNKPAPAACRAPRACPPMAYRPTADDARRPLRPTPLRPTAPAPNTAVYTKGSPYCRFAGHACLFL